MRLGFGRGFGRTLAVLERMNLRRGFGRSLPVIERMCLSEFLTVRWNINPGGSD